MSVKKTQKKTGDKGYIREGTEHEGSKTGKKNAVKAKMKIADFKRFLLKIARLCSALHER